MQWRESSPSTCAIWRTARRRRFGNDEGRALGGFHFPCRRARGGRRGRRRRHHSLRGRVRRPSPGHRRRWHEHMVELHQEAGSHGSVGPGSRLSVGAQPPGRPMREGRHALRRRESWPIQHLHRRRELRNVLRRHDAQAQEEVEARHAIRRGRHDMARRQVLRCGRAAADRWKELRPRIRFQIPSCEAARARDRPYGDGHPDGGVHRRRVPVWNIRRRGEPQGHFALPAGSVGVQALRRQGERGLCEDWRPHPYGDNAEGPRRRKTVDWSAQSGRRSSGRF